MTVTFVQERWRRAALLLSPAELATDAGRARERQRRIALTAMAAALARIVSVGSALVSVPMTLHYLGAERYGMWMVLSSFVAILGFADLGVGNGVLTLMARLSGRDDIAGMRALISSAVMILAILALTLGGAFAVLYGHIDWPALFNVTGIVARAEAGPAMAVFALCFLAAFPLAIVQKVQAGLQQGFSSSLWQAGGSLLGLVTLLVVVRAEGGLPWLVAALLGAPQLMTAVNALWFFGLHRRDLRPAPALARRGVMAGVLSTGLLFLVLQLVVAATYSADSLIISHLLGPTAVAGYAVPEKMFATVSAVLSMITTPLWPAFGEAITRGDRAWVRRMLKRALLINVGLAATAGAALLVLGPWLIHLWVGPAVTPSLLLLAGFGVWKMCEAAGSPIAMLLNGAHVVWPQIVFSAVTAIVAIGLKISIVPQIGVAGAVWSTAGAFLLFALLPLGFVAHKVTRIEHASTADGR